MDTPRNINDARALLTMKEIAECPDMTPRLNDILTRLRHYEAVFGSTSTIGLVLFLSAQRIEQLQIEVSVLRAICDAASEQ